MSREVDQITTTEHSAERARFAIGGMEPARVLHPADEQEVAAALLAARDAHEAVVPAGGATMLDIGDVPSRYDLAVVTDRITGIVEYNPGDLTIVVRAGTTLAEVESELQRHGQFLSLQAPHPERATVGGALASNAGGPLRVAYGSARDAVIGTRVALPNGQIARSGGRVVKNVAGYDLSKLFIGSFGTLGIIVEAAFKVFPLGQATRLLVVTAPTMEGCMAFAASLPGIGPGVLANAVVNAGLAATLNLTGPCTVLLLGGTRAAIDEVAAEIATRAQPLAVETCDDAERDRVMDGLRDFPGRATVRLSTRTESAHTAVAVSEQVQALVYPTIGTSYVSAPHWNMEDVSAVRLALERVGGHMVIWHRTPGLNDVSTWGELGPEMTLMRAVKSVFDPTRTMSPGRFVGGI